MIVINCTGSDTIQLHELTEFQGELKERSAGDIEKIIKSIKKHGFSFPFFVWKNDGKNNVLDGHGRLLALKQMAAAGEEIPALPCVYISAKDEAEAKEKLLKLNSQYGHMTADSVAAFLGDIKIDFDELALPDGLLDLSAVLQDDDTKNDDNVPAAREDEPAQSKAGEIYELGEHRLICGDSTDEATLARLMGGAKADLILTDPPYNVDYTGKTKESLKIDNDKKSDAEFKQFLTTAYKAMFSVAKAGAAYYIFYANKHNKEFINALAEAGIRPHQILVWVKNKFTLSYDDYKWKHEPIMYGWKDGGSHSFYGALNESTAIDQRKDPDKMSKQELIQELKRIERATPQDVIYEKKLPRNAEHPTMKPVEILARLIRNSTKSEDIVLDPFGGSGSTLIAAAKTGRTARLCEIDPHYCDVIRKRWTAWAKENGYAVGTGGLE